MKPHQTNRHTIQITYDLDCEARLCGRCEYRYSIGGMFCDKFRFKPLSKTRRGHWRRLPECLNAEIVARPDPHTSSKHKRAKRESRG